MEFDLSREQASIIKVIGVGGGGSNAVNHMYKQGIKGVEFVVCNTDWQALSISPVPTKIQLGGSLTDGRGAGSIPEVGRNAAIENIEDIRKLLLENTRMVFITAGMGGGTGTGAAPIIAQTAREMGILTVGIVTVPFDFEGKKRKIQAEDGIEALKNSVDTILIIRNEKLREMFGNLRLSEAFSHADDILTTAAKGIAEIITVTGYINVDFEDVKTAVQNSGVAIMGSAIASGENRAISAVEQALASPLLNDNNIKGARYILMNIVSGSREVTMDEIGEITDYIQDQAGLTADIIWGNCSDDSLDEKLGVTIIATGFKTREELGKEEDKRIQSGRTIHVLSEETAAKPVQSETPSTPAYQEPELFEPVLKTHAEETRTAVKDELVVEFNLTPKKNEVPIPEARKDEQSPDKENAKVYDLNDHTLEDRESEDQFAKSRERIQKLKALNFKLGTSNINDIEKEPAYRRRNVKMDQVTHSADSNVSRYTLSGEEEKKNEIRPNNSFLHDNVD